MNNEKLKTGNEEIDKALKDGLPIDSFVTFAEKCYGHELQPYQKVLLSQIQEEEISNEKFIEKYQLNRMVSFNKSQIISTPLSDNELFNFHVAKVVESKKQTSWVIIDDPINKD